MKKYRSVFIFIAAAGLTLSGCGNSGGVRTYIDTDNIPSLTAVPWETTVLADTYSQYMATYTESTAVNSDSYYVFSRPQNVLMDTAAAFGGRSEGQNITAPPRDTAAAHPRFSGEDEICTETASVNAWKDGGNSETTENTETSVTESEIPENGGTSLSETSTRAGITVPKVTGASVQPVEKAPTDTKYEPNVPADTRFKPEKTADSTVNEETN